MIPQSHDPVWRHGLFRCRADVPGIAGVILTIGVGIDFERSDLSNVIREELRAGKTAVSAVITSFNRVFITLVDTHLAASDFGDVSCSFLVRGR